MMPASGGSSGESMRNIEMAMIHNAAALDGDEAIVVALVAGAHAYTDPCNRKTTTTLGG
jgi:hypothetical protein